MFFFSFLHEFSFCRSLTDVLDQECFDGLKDIVPEVIERRAMIFAISSSSELSSFRVYLCHRF